MIRRALFAIALAALVTGCNGGSSSPPPFFTGASPTPTPTPTPLPASASGTLTTSTTASSSRTLGPIGPGDFGTVSCTPTLLVAHLAIVYSLTQPGGTPAVQRVARLPRNINGTNITPFGYFTVTPDVTVTCPNTPSFAMAFPPGTVPPSAAGSYVAVFDPGNAGAGWNTISGPAAQSGNTLTWTSGSVPFPLVAGRTYSFVLFTTGSTLAVPTPTPTPTATPSPVPLHLYVGNDYAGAQILQFNLPLTASTTSNFTMIAGGNVVALALDANGDLLA